MFRKLKARLVNSLAHTEIEIGWNSWLIFLFIIKPGYLPEQPESHGPGSRADLLLNYETSYFTQMTEEMLFRWFVPTASMDEHRREHKTR